jgi:hypothetical protein
MTRKELVDKLTLNEITDDYEDFARILRNVVSEGAVCGLTISPFEVEGSINRLIKRDLARAYVLSGHAAPKVFEGPVEGDLVDALYYFATENGRDLNMKGEEDWPFDDDGALRVGWSAPTD